MRRRPRRPLECGHHQFRQKMRDKTPLKDRTKYNPSKDVLHSSRNILLPSRNSSEKSPIVFVLFLIVLVMLALISSNPANCLDEYDQTSSKLNNFTSTGAITTTDSSTRKIANKLQVSLKSINVSSESTTPTNKQRKRQQKVKPVIAQSANDETNKQQRVRGNSWRSSSKSNFRQSSPDYAQASTSAPQTTSLDKQQSLSAITNDDPSDQLQVSISARVNLVRVPIESNAILKCLISSQTNKFARPFRIRWSRFLYDENVYEQIDTSSTGFEEDSFNSGQSSAVLATDSLPATTANKNVLDKRQAERLTLNRQQQLRDFLSRSRQETNVISDLLIEATLSISPVKAGDNATYYCSASDINSQQLKWPPPSETWEQRARIDLLALSSPSVRLDRVQPARDSKSALVFWSILSDGNTPIKRTILMFKNTSQTSLTQQNNNNFDFDFFPGRNSTQQGNKQQSSSYDSESNAATNTGQVIIDQDHQQWQRIDILGEGDPVDGGQLAESMYNSSSFASATSSIDRSPSDRQTSLSRASINDDSDVVRASIDTDAASPIADGHWRDQSSRSRSQRNNKKCFYNLTGLLPGLTYQLKLAAINDMGQSTWTQLSSTMPNEIPAQIQDVVVLSNSNDSITIGWRRPPWDNAKTLRYEMQLFDLNRTLTLDANTNTTGHLRTNYMFHFVGLQPGTDYHFHIRACSRAGCSVYSSPKLMASTLDGEPDEPQDVELNCGPSSASSSPSSIKQQQQHYSAIVSWLPPRESRGRLLNYSIHLESSSRYRNSSGHWTSEEWRTSIETNDNHTLSFDLSSGLGRQLTLMPNTNYAVRVCANNRWKNCGKLSANTHKSRCFIPAQLPEELPLDIRLSFGNITTSSLDLADNSQKPEDFITSSRNQANTDQTMINSVNDQMQTSEAQQIETLFVEFPFMSWRNGSIDCIQIVLIKLPASFDGSRSKPLSDFLPEDPAEIRMHEYLDLVAKVANNLDSQPESTTLSAEQSQQSQEGQDESLGSDEQTSKERKLSSAEQQVLEFKQNRAFAYLAEELDSAALWSDMLTRSELARGRRRIALGDGHQFNCRSVWSAAQDEPTSKGESSRMRRNSYQSEKSSSFIDTSRSRRLQPLDGSLFEDTYYTGFLRLIHARRNNLFSEAETNSSRRNLDKRMTNGNLELATKYSNYFSPVKTGRKVPEVPMDMLLSNQYSSMSPNDGQYHSGSANKRAQSELSLCRWSWLVDFQSRAFGSTKACRLLSEFTNSMHRNMLNLSRTLVNSFSDTNTLASSQNSSVPASSSLARLLQRANGTNGELGGPIQVLVVGLVVIGLSLAILLIIYLFTLPASARKRKKQRKLRKKLQEHEAAALANQALSKDSNLDQTGGFKEQQQQQQVVQIHPSDSQQEVAPKQSPYSAKFDTRTNQHEGLKQPIECPIHSSPTILRQQQPQPQPSEDMYATQRRQSDHVCPPQQQPVARSMQHQPHHSHQISSETHRHKHHHQSQYHLDHYQQQQQAFDYGRNCLTMRRADQPIGVIAQYNRDYYDHLPDQQHPSHHHHHHHNHQHQQQQTPSARAAMTLQHGVGGGSLAATVLALAKKINKSIPLTLFHSVLECRLRNGWLREEYEQLPRVAAIIQQQQQQNLQTNHQAMNSNLQGGRHIKLRPQLIVSRDDSVSALISGNEFYDGSIIKLQRSITANNTEQAIISHPIERQFICAKSPLDADSVWDFWRLIYEREVSTLVMLTPNEDVHTGELRCAQYWPTCDNEETTILSPCNEHVQSSNILPAKFKIRQETLSSFDDTTASAEEQQQQQQYLQLFKVRRLTLLVMATKLSENEHILASSSATSNGTNGTLGVDENDHQQTINGVSKDKAEDEKKSTNGPDGQLIADAKSSEISRHNSKQNGTNEQVAVQEDLEDDDEDEEKLIIVERQVLHFQFLHWNASSSSNQAKLIKFIEFVNERHARQLQLLASPGANWQQCGSTSPILVHCANGIGRSGLFATMSYVIDDLQFKIQQQQLIHAGQHESNSNGLAQQKLIPKVNLFQLVAKLRSQRDMLLSPYRFYELLYQLTARCIPVQP